jgi:hypothetical protein
MKKMISILIVIGIFHHQSISQELSLDKILDKFYKENAFDKLQKVKTIVMTGTITRNDLMPYKITKMRPDKIRIDFELADLEAVQAYDGQIGWSTAPWTGNPKPVQMNEDAAGGMKIRADFDGILYKWKEKGHLALLIGKDTINGIEVYKIQISKKAGGKEYYFIGSKDFLLHKQLGSRVVRGQEVDLESFFRDYRKIEGIWFAYTNETRMGGQPYSIVEFEKIELNLPVDEKIFEMPK